MLNFKEELQKFKPHLELGQVEESIQSDEIQDMIDLLGYIAKNIESKSKDKE
jgi:hypothetical protein